jgi:hypothetical protein
LETHCDGVDLDFAGLFCFSRRVLRGGRYATMRRGTERTPSDVRTDRTTEPTDNDAWGEALEKYVSEHGGCVPVSFADFGRVGLIAIQTERERCAKIAEAGPTGKEIAQRIRNGECYA